MTLITIPSANLVSSLLQLLLGENRRHGASLATDPTPREHTLQQMGLVITTKNYGLHLRNSTRKMGTEPPIFSDAPILVDAIGVPEISFPDISTDTFPVMG